MAEQNPHREAFTHNAQVALQSGTFEDVLKAIGMKLLELGVPGAETPDVADKVNHPLKMAYLKARTQEAGDRAWDGIAARIFHLGRLLPPEAADGAFLADRTQVEELVGRYRAFWENRLVESIKKQDQERGDDGEAERESTDTGIPPLEGDIFEGLGQHPDFFRTLYSGVQDQSGRRESGQDTKADGPQSEAPPTAGSLPTGDRVNKRAVERQFFKDAALGSPFHGDVKVIDVFNNEVLTKLLWAIQENTANDVLWALTVKLNELGVPAAPTEEETARLIMALTLSYVYVAEHNDTGVRRQAVDTLRLHLLRVVGLMPRDVWATDFLDTREAVLALIGDRVQDSDGPEPAP